MKNPVMVVNVSQDNIALVDISDYEKVSKYKWSYHGDGYAARGYNRNGKIQIVKMHHEIIGYPPSGKVVDHINGNKLDNRKCNLRFITQQQNCFNAKKRSKCSGIHPSKYKGVVWRNDRNKWRSVICINGVKKYLGLFSTEEEAALAYNKAAKELFGNYAKLNEI